MKNLYVNYRNLIGMKIAMLSSINIVSADDFPPFTVPLGPYEVSGYIENIGDAQTSLRLLPTGGITDLTLRGSGGMDFHYKIWPSDAFLRKVKMNREKLLSIIRKDVPSLPQGAGMTSLPMKDVEVSLVVGNSVFYGSKLPNYRTAGAIPGTITIPSGDLSSLSRLYDVGAILRLTYDVRISEYSSLNVNFEQTSMAESRVNGFKRYLRKIDKKSGGFLFWKWQSEIVSENTEIQTDKRSSSHTSKSLTVIHRDPSPEMLQRLNEYIGITRLGANQVVKNHLQAATNARNAGDEKLAILYEKYAAAVKNNNREAQIDIIMSLTSLANGDIAGFLANGIAFDSSKSSVKQECYVVSNTLIKTRMDSKIEEYLLKSLHVKFMSNFLITKDMFAKIMRVNIAKGLPNQKKYVGNPLLVEDSDMKFLAQNVIGDVHLWRYAIRKKLISSDEVILGKKLIDWAVTAKNKPCIRYLESIGQKAASARHKQ